MVLRFIKRNRVLGLRVISGSRAGEGCVRRIVVRPCKRPVVVIVVAAAAAAAAAAAVFVVVVAVVAVVAVLLLLLLWLWLLLLWLWLWLSLLLLLLSAAAAQPLLLFLWLPLVIGLALDAGKDFYFSVHDKNKDTCSRHAIDCILIHILLMFPVSETF